MRMLILSGLLFIVLVSGCVDQTQQPLVKDGNDQYPAVVNNTIEQLKFFEKRSDQAVRLTDCYPKSCQNPAFSPDSNELLFTRFLNGYNKGPSELVVLNLETNEEKVVVKGDVDNVNVPYGSWIGNEIVFSRDGKETNEIFIINDDGSNLRQLTDHSGPAYIEPVFNPTDANFIVFEQSIDNNPHNLALYSRKLQRVFTLTEDQKYDDRLPSWSSDGKKILWQRSEIGKDDWKVFAADIALQNSPYLKNIKRVTDGPDDTDNSWTWDGNVLSSRTGNGNVPNIFLLADWMWYSVTNGIKEDGAPSQSPNKKWIAFESHIGDENSQSDIWITGFIDKYSGTN